MDKSLTFTLQRLHIPSRRITVSESCKTNIKEGADKANERAVYLMPEAWKGDTEALRRVEKRSSNCLPYCFGGEERRFRL